MRTCVTRVTRLRTVLAALLCGVVAAISAGPVRAATIYFDPLTGSSANNLNGTTPPTDNYTGTAGPHTWSASTIFKADGSVTTSGSSGSAALPFTPTAGNVYTLTAERQHHRRRLRLDRPRVRAEQHHHEPVQQRQQRLRHDPAPQHARHRPEPDLRRPQHLQRRQRRRRRRRRHLGRHPGHDGRQLESLLHGERHAGRQHFHLHHQPDDRLRQPLEDQHGPGHGQQLLPHQRPRARHRGRAGRGAP